ncbi:MAG TPA: protein kinase [Thermoanaerobaculia bacterium]|jgi:tetratricopeptide (TPR) repeat protein|nr:protein kinase [Thermoanaerobaculia bacterium]
MSTIDPFSAGAIVDNYRLIERIGATVWKGVDLRNERQVAVKILTKQLPKDATRRDTLVRETRLAAAIYHAFVVPIMEIAVAGDSLLMVMEWFEGEPVTNHVHAQPMQRAAFFRSAAQLVEAVKFLHAKGVIHGNLNGDSVIINADGRLRLGGLNIANLLRREGRSSEYAQKGSDPRSVAYMAPEQITGQVIDERTDVFSFGSVCYEMATGALPFAGKTASDIARSVVDGKPVPPNTVNPAIDNAMMAVLGKCLFKDSFRRVKEMKAIGDDIARFDAEAAKYMTEQATRVVSASAASTSTKRRALLLLADAAEGDDSGAQVQQLVGEAAMLFDGNVVDPFSAKVVAEMPSLDSALEAARKVEFDLTQVENPLPVRLLLHAGEVETRDGALVGDAVTRGLEVLQQLPPRRLFISEAFVKDGRGNARLRDAGAKAGVKLFEIVPPEPEIAQITTAELEQIAAEEEAKEQVVAKTVTRSRNLRLAAIAAGLLVLLLGGSAAMLLRNRTRSTEAQVEAPKGPEPLGPATAKAPRKVTVPPFTVQDPALADRATVVRAASIEVLRSYPELRVVDEPAADVTSLTATMRGGAGGPEILPAPDAQPAAAPDAATAIDSVVQWVAGKVQMQRRAAATPAAVNAFADALAASAAKDDAKTDASLRASIKADPSFLPAQRMAMTFFETRGKDADALAAARQVVALEPENLEAARKLARAGLRGGDVADAFTAYTSILRRNPSDAEALNAIGRYAAGAADPDHFQKALRRLRGVSPREVAVHEPDILVATGHLENAIDKYYDIEVNVPDNPALSLKIGRVAVLRRTMPIADLELAKLARNDPNYGFHILQAYLAAQQRDRATAGKELDEARKALSPGDEYWTCAAEVYAILGDTKAVIAALENAAARREPTTSYVLTNPLFAYLKSDPRFQKVRVATATNQRDIRTALQNVL